MKAAAIIAVLVLACAFIGWRVFRAPKLAPPPPIFTVGQLHEGTRAIYEAGLLPADVTGTGSMEPYIPRHRLGVGIIVAVAGMDRTPFDSLRAGDFVVYRSGRQNLIHRLGERTDGGFVAYGTANETADAELVTESKYLGRVAVVYRLP